MNVFLISDTHFGHLGVTKFLTDEGEPMRPYNDVVDMDEDLIMKWNSVVGEKDKVYHLGDVLINRRAFPTLSRLAGQKILIKGNHDLFRLKEYLPYFKDIRAYHKLDNYLLSHIPVHPCSVSRWDANIHGHLHHNRVMLGDRIDPRYFNMCVEHHNYYPVPFETVRQMIKEQQSE